MSYNIPLSLYIHLPWCIRKCPYCDFNSHESKDIPEQQYIDRLIEDFDHSLSLIQSRPLASIFLGGGTPSLFSAEALDRLFRHIKQACDWHESIEVTMEANPGTVEQQRFAAYREIGINRLSLGIQSFDPKQLQRLGRIHDSDEACNAINIAKQAGFTNLNIDLMYGLPQQTIEQAVQDLKTAISFQPQHISWYQLTIEPNTVFYSRPPVLPHDDNIIAMEVAGRDCLHTASFQQYEVSAYAQAEKQCQHNLNYWRFGDYLGIGAGAHGKSTDLATGRVSRIRKLRQPKDYLDTSKSVIAEKVYIDQDNLIFEFMLNALRLHEDVSFSLFTERTGLPIDSIATPLDDAVANDFITVGPESFSITDHGRLFLNDLMGLFLSSE